MQCSDHSSSPVCGYHCSIKNSGELLKTKFFVHHSLIFILFRACQFCRKKNKLLTFLRSDHMPHISVVPIIFLSPWFSILSCPWHSCLNLFSCVQHVRHVYRHSSVIMRKSHPWLCLSLLSLKQHNWDILFFKYYIFFPHDFYKSNFSWCLPHLYQRWELK